MRWNGILKNDGFGRMIISYDDIWCMRMNRNRIHVDSMIFESFNVDDLFYFHINWSDFHLNGYIWFEIWKEWNRSTSMIDWIDMKSNDQYQWYNKSLYFEYQFNHHAC